MGFFKYLNIAKLVIDGVRAVVRVIRKNKDKNKFERTLDDIDEITDVITPGQNSDKVSNE